MQRRARPKFTFFMTGFVLWALVGGMIAMICFQPVVPLEELGKNKELATKVSNDWSSIMAKTAIIWALAGGILGVIISQLFMARPQHEHFSRVPKLSGMPEMPGLGSGPKTMAEIIAGFQSWILGAILGVCGTVFILPILESELIIAKSLSIRIIFGLIQTVIATVPILPFSLRILSKKYERG